MIIRKDTTKARRADKTTGRGAAPACGLLPLWGFGGTIADNHFIFFIKYPFLLCIRTLRLPSVDALSVFQPHST